tara:strand:+ start:229 stop:573 length:345 start_codon:yes stop_codon:yes gene_type:complete
VAAQASIEHGVRRNNETCGKATSTIKQIIIASQNGRIPTSMSRIGTSGATPLKTNTFMPTGGLMSAIIQDDDHDQRASAYATKAATDSGNCARAEFPPVVARCFVMAVGERQTH